MKKTLAAVAVLGAFAGSALAADVTLYGKVDLGLQYTHSETDFDDVKTPDTDYDKFALKSGGNSSSRFGLKGVEEISEGLKVGFQLEHGFTADDNEATKLFSREMRLYVTSDFGTLHMGRFGGLDSNTGSVDMTGDLYATTGYGDAIAVVDEVMHVNGDRFANSIAYTSPEFAGVTVSAMASLGKDVKDANDKVIAREGSSKVDRYYALGAMGQWGALGAGVVVSTEDFADVRTKDKDQDNSMNVTAGVNYDFGIVKTFLAANYYDNGLRTKDYGVVLSAVAPVGSGDLEVSAGYGKTKTDSYVNAKNEKVAEEKGDAFTVGAMYKYPLSKRTYVYAGAGYTEVEDKDVQETKTYQVVSGLCHNF